MVPNARTQTGQEETSWEMDTITQPLGRQRYPLSPSCPLKHPHADPLYLTFMRLPFALNSVLNITQELVGISYLNAFAEIVQSIIAGLGIRSRQNFKIQYF